jgi:hypothetical protein
MRCLYGIEPGGVVASDILPRDGYSWTVVGCVSSDTGGFVGQARTFITNAAGGIALLAILYGGFLIMTSRGNPRKLQQGKSLIIGAISATLLIIFAVYAFQFVNQGILKLPGTG